ncbi:MAG: hypothetical protein LBR36_02325 [Bacteroidales bacterium]|nr:hypothetical protein [Bacteroidales bacterium]
MSVLFLAKSTLPIFTDAHRKPHRRKECDDKSRCKSDKWELLNIERL